MVTESKQLAKVENVAQLAAYDAQVAKWARERVDLIKRTVCPPGISDTEFALFVEQCRRSDLDPLLNEAFCVPRTSRAQNPKTREWEDVTKNVFQPSEAGMRARAERFPDYRGMKAAVVYEGDTIEINDGDGVVVHKSNPLKCGRIVMAWAQVFRDGRVMPIARCRLEDYAQKKRDGSMTQMWAQKTATMLVKCARAEALRLAYPSAFGGLYISEEMPREERDEPAKPEPKKVRQTSEQKAAAPANASDKQGSSSAPVVPAPAAPAPKADVIEGQVVAEGKTESGRAVRIVDVPAEPAKSEEPPPPTAEHAPTAEPEGDRVAELIYELGDCGADRDMVTAWRDRKNAAHAKKPFNADELAKLRDAFAAHKSKHHL